MHTTIPTRFPKLPSPRIKHWDYCSESTEGICTRITKILKYLGGTLIGLYHRVKISYDKILGTAHVGNVVGIIIHYNEKKGRICGNGLKDEKGTIIISIVTFSSLNRPP